jgi:peptidoglycan/LPS O-acetylase OafA/YrhL
MAFIVMIGALVVSSDFTLPGWVFGVLAAPALVEFCVEHLSSIRYSPRRQVVLSVLAGVGLGVGFARYLEHPTDAWFWATAVGFLLIGGLAALVGSRKQQA